MVNNVVLKVIKEDDGLIIKVKTERGMADAIAAMITSLTGVPVLNSIDELAEANGREAAREETPSMVGVPETPPEPQEAPPATVQEEETPADGTPAPAREDVAPATAGQDMKQEPPAGMPRTHTFRGGQYDGLTPVEAILRDGDVACNYLVTCMQKPPKEETRLRARAIVAGSMLEEAASMQDMEWLRAFSLMFEGSWGKLAETMGVDKGMLLEFASPQDLIPSAMTVLQNYVKTAGDGGQAPA